jgi:hypothetical protein
MYVKNWYMFWTIVIFIIIHEDVAEEKTKN